MPLSLEALLVHFANSIGALLPLVVGAFAVYWIGKRPSKLRAFTALVFLLLVWQVFHGVFIASEYWMESYEVSGGEKMEEIPTWLTATNKIFENDQSEVLQLIIQGGVAGGFLSIFYWLRPYMLEWKQSKEFGE
jgi:hypothetical protein